MITIMIIINAVITPTTPTTIKTIIVNIKKIIIEPSKVEVKKGILVIEIS